jgi:hypothetical protein
MEGGRRYEILGVLGKGGFGTVYRARMLGEGGFAKVVALKVLNPDVRGIEEVASRLRDEARVLGLVRHRALVEVDGLVRLEGRWAVVMECVEGGDLAQILEAVGPFPPAVALELVEELCSALHRAMVTAGPDGQPLGLIHRDLKPSNVQLTRDGEVKLLDFGTARADFASREAETRSLAFGTPLYMAPERMEFEDLPAGDVYALGAMLFELLCAEPLGQSSPNPARHEALLESARSRLEGLPEGAVGLVLSCLRIDPLTRPPVQELGRSCREARASLGRPWLADWAPEAVARVLEGRGPEGQDGWTGQILTEQSGGWKTHSSELDEPDDPALVRELGGHTEWVRVPAEAPPEPAAVPAPVELPEDEVAIWKWPVAAVSLVVLLVLGGLLLWPPGVEVPDPVLEVVQPGVPAVQPVPEPVPEPSPEPTVEPSPEPTVDPVPEPAVDPEPLPEPVEPRARPAAPERGVLEVEGDALELVLTRGGRAYTPGRLAPGTYDVQVRFEGRELLPTGSVEIRSGQTTVLRCSAAFVRCQPG